MLFCYGLVICVMFAQSTAMEAVAAAADDVGGAAATDDDDDLTCIADLA